MTGEDLCNWIDQQIGKNASFAVYRIPGETKLRFVQQETGPLYEFAGIESLSNRSGFVIAPFRAGGSSPLVLIGGREETFNIVDFADGGILYEPAVRQVNTISPDYSKRYETFIDALQSGKLDKLVLSRRTECNKSASFLPGKTFLEAVHRYIRSYVYLCHTPVTGTWLGSTPEIILSGKGSNWHTVALAGTQHIKEGRLPESWDDKNRREQRIVAEYVYSQLLTAGIHPVEEGPYTVRAAELAHLKSDFRFTLPNKEHLGDLLKLLHPTPAVCGLPKEEAYRFILDNEGYNREYYSGFIGMLNPEGTSNLYVNLRCMKVLDDKLYLYAGGGLLASSTLEEEWQETEDKLFTMRALIHN